MSRRNLVLIAAVAIGVLVSVLTFIQWEASRECVRWSTRIDVTRSGGIRQSPVSAEFRPRRYGEEPPFDPRAEGQMSRGVH